MRPDAGECGVQFRLWLVLTLPGLAMVLAVSSQAQTFGSPDRSAAAALAEPQCLCSHNQSQIPAEDECALDAPCALLFPCNDDTDCGVGMFCADASNCCNMKVCVESCGDCVAESEGCGNFDPCTSAPVPLLSPWGLLAMLLLLSGAGAAVLSRRNVVPRGITAVLLVAISVAGASSIWAYRSLAGTDACADSQDVEATDPDHQR
jgi:hypothetical protein